MTKIWESLESLGLTSEQTIKLFAERTRDNPELKVWVDEISEVIFIKDHYVGDAAYTSSQYVADSPVDEKPRSYEDKRNLDRRLSEFKHYVWGRDVCDFGCGAGLFLEALKSDCSSVFGIELQERHLSSMRNRGIPCSSSLEDLPNNSIDCMVSFHVIEHLPDPLYILRALYRKLKPGGILILEVPHARDLLLSGPASSESFRNFTLWSQHLVLHTRRSLATFLSVTGFKSAEIRGVQRYPLSNHLNWLAKGMPGGHVGELAELESGTMSEEYASALSRIDRTDTLIAVARKPV